MKAFIFFALVAAAYADPTAEAEADPAYLYAGYYGYPYAHAGYYGYGAYPYYGYGYGLKSAPCVNAANQPVPCAHGIYKREAEAESKPEADPAYFAVPTAYGAYASPYGYAPYAYGHALVHTSHFGVCTNYVGARVPC